MNTESIIERYVVDEIMIANNETKLDPNQSLLNSGIIDSLALLRLITFIEERFGIKIEDEEVIPENFETINEIKSLIERKQT